MTEKIYLRDSYAKETGAKLIALNGSELEFDRTVFYPTGGGEPFDTGTIEMDGTAYNVIEVRKSEDRVIHVVDKPPSAQPGASAMLRIDWERRYLIMRQHTAVHVIDGIVENEYESGQITGGMIYPDRAHFDLDMPALGRELAIEILDKAQKVIDEGHQVKPEFLTKEEALKIPSLARTEPGRRLLQGLDTVRVIDIKGFDMQLDGGTHVADTKEVGKIVLIKIENKGSHRKRIEFTVR